MSFLNLLKDLFFPSPRSIRKRLSPVESQQVRDRWQKVEKLLALGGPSQLRQAVIEADKLIDSVLKQLVEGETMGERLKAAELYFNRDSYNRLWQAHKLRNVLVHETDIEPGRVALKEAIEKFQDALSKLI